LINPINERSNVRQEDSLSPYLFVLAIEVVSQLMEEASSGFDFYPGYAEIGFSHLCFAEAFIMENLKYVQCIEGVLDSFSDLSSFSSNPTKSTLFLSGIPDDVKTQIRGCLNMEEDKLPAR
jgi:hypothetical protein